MKPFVWTMLHQDLPTLSRLELLIIDEMIPVGDVVNGAVDLAVEAP
jgi:hypothetical protein